jgi:ADP-heptose:LPS heptosyltransferase/protein-S-isoprenylcysteine O-methyltransferase Ste14
MSRPKIFRYLINQKLRRAAHWIMRLAITGSQEERVELRHKELKKILIVRATFRLGDSILAVPAILWFRKCFPQARIDFVGAPVSAKLFQNLPIDHHFTITRRYPGSALHYPLLLRRLRSVGYDLAVDVSCSQSAMGSFIVGLSRARFRVGLKGKWDQWFNVRIPRPSEKNKYRVLPAFLRSLGLEPDDSLLSLALTSAEIEEGRRRIQTLPGCVTGKPTVGVFVGGRKAWGKRWPLKSFCELIAALRSQSLNVVTFFGPEEKDSVGYFRDALVCDIPIVFEPSIRNFAAMVSNCDLFVTCDSGPMHMACGLGIRTVAIFQHPNFDHWGPPSSVARIVYEPDRTSSEGVFRICLEELSLGLPRGRDAGDTERQPLPLVWLPEVSNALRRLEKSIALRRALFLSRCAQAVFLLSLLIYAWFFPPFDIFSEGWAEEFADVVEVGIPLLGGLLRLWAVSHRGKWPRQDRDNVSTMITTGPYAYVRHPLYVANLLIGFGMVFLSGAFPLGMFLLAFFALYHTILIPAEEDLLKEKFGDEFVIYSESVPKYIPLAVPKGFSFGTHFPAAELATISGIFLAAGFFEWIEQPVRRDWIFSLFQLMLRG